MATSQLVQQSCTIMSDRWTEKALIEASYNRKFSVQATIKF